MHIKRLIQILEIKKDNPMGESTKMRSFRLDRVKGISDFKPADHEDDHVEDV